MSDHDRPLNARGRRTAPAMAQHFLEQSLSVDVILASTAERVRETVALLQLTWASDAHVFQRPSLYLASPRDILAEIRTLDDSWQSVLVVGHNPGLVSLLSQLAGQELDMPTAAVGILDIHAPTWDYSHSAESSRLRAYWRPRELPSQSQLEP